MAKNVKVNSILNNATAGTTEVATKDFKVSSQYTTAIMQDFEKFMESPVKKFLVVGECYKMTLTSVSNPKPHKSDMTYKVDMTFDVEGFEYVLETFGKVNGTYTPFFVQHAQKIGEQLKLNIPKVADIFKHLIDNQVEFKAWYIKKDDKYNELVFSDPEKSEK